MREYTTCRNNKHLMKKIKSRKFKLSERILDIRYQLGLSFEETARILNLNEKDYMNMEYADENVSEEEYLKAIEKLENL